MQIIRRLIEVLTVCIVVVVLLVATYWSALSRFGIDASLRTYARAVRQANSPLHERERLLDLIDDLRDRLNDGEQTSLLRWIGHDEAVREMIANGITPDELQLIERELQRAQKAFEKPH